MADNVAITAGTGTTIAADDISGVLHQRVKISQGADGTGVDVSSAAPLQVTLANTGANTTPVVVDLGANNDVTVTGTVTANANSGVDIGDVTINNSTGGAAVNIQDGGNSITVDGTIAISTINSVAPAFGSGTVGATVQRITLATDSPGIIATAAHDAADTGDPIKVGGYASAAAPSAVSADGDRVNAWFLRNGAQAINLTAAGALIAGDASNGLDVDVTRVPRVGTTASATFTCGTTAYAIDDAVGASGAAAALTFALAPAACELLVTSASLMINATALISGEGAYRLELFNATPPSAINDSAAWGFPSGDQATHIGTIYLGVPVDKGSTLKVEVDGINKQITTASGNVYAYLVSDAAYTPTARAFTVVLHGTPV